jgi:peptidoglycan/xylan/chitin deacetylase (PgdA/CDA1 family)
MARPIPILLYHGVDRDGPTGLAPFVMAPDRFAAHMDLLVERGTPTLTVSEYTDLLDRGDEPDEGTVLVTFDDGLGDFDRHAWPILHERSLAATLYVVSGCVGGPASWLAPFGPPPAMLEWDQVIRLDREGCEIGAHSRTHPELDTLRPDDLADEVRTSRTELSIQLGHPVRSFAYPHGYHGKRVKDAVRNAGFDSACAVRNMTSSTTDDRFALARVTIGADCDVDGLQRILDGEQLRTAPRREQLRTRGWRTYRRIRRHRSVAA